jgi:hypothetical protein
MRFRRITKNQKTNASAGDEELATDKFAGKSLYLALKTKVAPFSWKTIEMYLLVISILALMMVYRMCPHPQSSSECALEKSPAPRPVILMALGRTGSSVLWDTLSRMTGNATFANEITGGNQEKSLQFFDRIHDNLSVTWAEKRLHQIQKHYKNVTNAAIVGFQWKPYRVTFDHPYAIGGLKHIATCRDPEVKVIHLTRNPIDTFLSNLRHDGHIRSKEVPAHCPRDDLECVESHRKHSHTFILPVGHRLESKISRALKRDEVIDERLLETGVQYIRVHYEKLFPSPDVNDASEWIKLLNFLHLKLKDDIVDSNNKKVENNELTMDIVRTQFSMSSTTASRRDSILNYDEVHKTLVEAGLGYLLD